MIELVPMAYRVVNEVDAALPDERVPAKAGRDSVKSTGNSIAREGGAATGNAVGSAGASGRKMDEEEERDAVFFRLEMLGYRVGQGLVERWVCLLLGLLYFSRVTEALGVWRVGQARRTMADQAPITASPATDRASQTPST